MRNLMVDPVQFYMEYPLTDHVKQQVPSQGGCGLAPEVVGVGWGTGRVSFFAFCSQDPHPVCRP